MTVLRMEKTNLQTKKEITMKNMIPQLRCTTRWISFQLANYSKWFNSGWNGKNERNYKNCLRKGWILNVIGVLKK